MASTYPEIETERLRLRQWRESDVDPFLAFYLDPLSAAIYGTDIKRSDVWRRVGLVIGHWHLRGYGPWVLEDKRTGKFAGHSGLWFPDGWSDVEVGYGIMPEFRGQGLAVEAATRVRDYGYREKKLDRLISYVDPSNKESRRVVEKLGATPDGEFLLHDKPHIIYLHTKH